MLIKATLPGEVSSDMLEMVQDYFYETANKYQRAPLRHVRLKNFETAEHIAPYLNMTVQGLRNYAADSRKLHGIIMPDGSLILHPDGCFVEIGKRGQQYLKKLTVLPRDLRRLLKNRQLETEH